MEYLKRELPPLEQFLDKQRTKTSEVDPLLNVEVGVKRLNSQGV